MIQIPCFNEAPFLPATIAALPRVVRGFDRVEVLVIDDGSRDGTAATAQSLGVDHVLTMNGNQGLARAFMAGIVACLDLGADVIVNTDADNQYSAADIEALVAPILAGEADMVVGARPIGQIRHFSVMKRIFQVLGSRIVRTISGADVRDATSGFRAISRHAALRLNVFNSFTYTIETIIQAGLSNLRVVSVPVHVNDPVRSSRLFRSNLAYIWRSVVTMLSVYLTYRPTRLFSVLALLFFLPGWTLGARYLVFMIRGEGAGHIQSVILSGALVVCGVLISAIGITAHLQGINRRLLEEIRCFLRSHPPPSQDRILKSLPSQSDSALHSAVPSQAAAASEHDILGRYRPAAVSTVHRREEIPKVLLQ
jgi:glycosyltransferase involved in cell wall biosynthesis